MRRKVTKGYPYTILPIDQKRIRPKLRPVEANEFLLIETLLRTPKIIELYRHDKQEFESYWHEYHGLFSHNPLGGSHHALLFSDKELDRKLLEMGYIDVGLGILNLGIVAKLPPGTMLRHGAIVLHGPRYGGADECKMRLQGQDPRFIHLRLDASQPPEAIIERLRPLLRARYKALEPRLKKQHLANDAVPKARILTRLKYFRCYDLQQQGLSIRKIADSVYKDQSNAEGNTTQALQRTRAMIRSVERSGLLPLKLQ